MFFVWMFLAVLMSMFAFALLPDRWCNRYTSQVIGIMRGQTALIFVSTLGIVSWSLLHGLPLNITFMRIGAHTLGFYFDALSLTLLALVGFMATIIGGYSVRYLQGEATQGRFIKGLLVTAASVMLFIASNHLLLFMVAWMLSSLGLRQLLVHYSDRPQAILAARQKFWVSRLGDVFLLGAFAIIYRSFGSWNYVQIFAELDVNTSYTPLMQLACFLLVAGAMTKSAQFPFHSWLPETMETPTPVSAFMHAGIINAGGFLILRLSPLLVKSPLALGTLAGVGGFTALFAALVMLTQTSIKKRLAYSTISQMGFMMLQCGLGAFTAATVHIVAHSLYKAHAFLSSGSLLNQAQQARSLHKPQASLSFLSLSGLAFVNLLLCGLAAWIWQVPVLTKPGGIILWIILSLGCTTLAVQAYENASRYFFHWTFLASFTIGMLYFAVYRFFDLFLHPVFQAPFLSKTLEMLLGFGVVFGFAAVFFLEKSLRTHGDSPTLRRFYILIRNEFYADIYLKRVCGWALAPRSHRPSNLSKKPLMFRFAHLSHSSVATPATPSCIAVAWDQIKGRVAPVWPLEDYVAVNPFMGLSHCSFMQAHQLLLQKGHHDILLPWLDYQKAYTEGLFTDTDLQRVIEISEPEFALSLTQLQEYLTTDISVQRNVPYHRLSEWMDLNQGTHWEMLIQDEMTRYCAAHYDQGFASWRSPWASLSLYDAWKIQAKDDKRLEKLGFTRLGDYLQQLPEEPLIAIEAVLIQMGVPTSDWEDVLYAYLLSIKGWAAWAQYQQRSESGNESDLCGLLAMRLIYEWALWQNSPYGDWPSFQSVLSSPQSKSTLILKQDQGRYLCQQAMEYAYRRTLFSKIGNNGQVAKRDIAAQFVFCLDVRSERMRRHLEHASTAVETFGFAGFFGVSMAYRHLGDATFIKQCPAPLEPTYSLEEKAEGNKHQANLVYDRHLKRRLLKKTWKQFKFSAISCFTFVESLGLGYVAQLLADSLGILSKRRTLENLSPGFDGPIGLSLEEQVQMAAGMLTQLGLIRDFAPLVVLCGHGSTVQNNPYQAAYDCGACCGHSGAPNALAAAKILNHPPVRSALLAQGICIPETTFFLAALHDTSRDNIHFLNSHYLPKDHSLAPLEQWIAEARQNTLKERAQVMGTPVKSLLRRSADWSELRPEWGLAGNAAFVIAKRSSTYRQDLEGRSFLHRYHHEDDAEGAVLESIMTAPMIVTHWINLQYYASSVSPQTYSSGNKALHNLVGNIGVLEGNSGDLKTGLPFQSVHNGQALQYRPLRLSVVIEAPRERIAQIIKKHPDIADLVHNAWLSLFAYDQQCIWEYKVNGFSGPIVPNVLMS